MKNKILAFLILVSVCGVFSAPAIIRAADTQYPGLVKCDGVVEVDAHGNQTNPNQKRCDFAALISQVQSIINWLFYIAVPIAIALFAYSGILYMMGTPDKVSQAKGIFTTVGIGFGFMCIAWFVVYTILGWITKSDQGFTTLLK